MIALVQLGVGFRFAWYKTIYNKTHYIYSNGCKITHVVCERRVAIRSYTKLPTIFHFLISFMGVKFVVLFSISSHIFSFWCLFRSALAFFGVKLFLRNENYFLNKSKEKSKAKQNENSVSAAAPDSERSHTTYTAATQQNGKALIMITNIIIACYYFTSFFFGMFRRIFVSNGFCHWYCFRRINNSDDTEWSQCFHNE